MSTQGAEQIKISDPPYNSDCDIFLGIDKGFRNPNVTL